MDKFYAFLDWIVLLFLITVFAALPGMIPGSLFLFIFDIDSAVNPDAFKRCWAAGTALVVVSFLGFQYLQHCKSKDGRHG